MARIETVNRALAADRLLLLLLQENDEEDPAPEDLRRIGTVGIVRQMARVGGGTHPEKEVVSVRGPVVETSDRSVTGSAACPRVGGHPRECVHELKRATRMMIVTEELVLRW